MQTRPAVRTELDLDASASCSVWDGDEPPARLRPPFVADVQFTRSGVSLKDLAAGSEAGRHTLRAVPADRAIIVTPDC